MHECDKKMCNAMKNVLIWKNLKYIHIYSYLLFYFQIITAVLLIIVLIEVVTGIKDLSKDGHYWKAYLIGPSIEGLTLVSVI